MNAYPAVAASTAHTICRPQGHPTPPRSKVLLRAGGAAGGKRPRDLASASAKNRVSFRFFGSVRRRQRRKTPEKSIMND